MPGYWLLLLLFALLFSLSFYFGLREWLWPRDDAPIPVDVEYVRQENYLGLSFRARVEEGLKPARPATTIHAGNSPLRTLLEQPDGESLLVLKEGQLDGDRVCEEVVYCEGDLRLADGAVLEKEIYCRGNFRSGAGVQLQAVAADGDLELGVENRVADWVDSPQKVRLCRGTVVHNRVTSSESIELESGVLALSLYAPLIFTSGYHPGIRFEAETVSRNPTHPRAAGEGNPARPLPSFLEGVQCSRLAEDTWLVQGELSLPEASRVETKLVVQGKLTTGADCTFAADVKAAEVKLGPRNRVLGNLVSEGVVAIGESCFVAKNIVAEKDVLLGSGVRVGFPEALAAVSAGGEIRMQPNAVVCGKLAAARMVITL